MTEQASEEDESAGGPPLSRAMREFGALLLTLSQITPAMSVFVIGSVVVSQAGTGAVWSFVAAAVVCIPVALVYAELSSAFPLTGQEYSIVGRVMGPSWGFMALGINIVGGAFSQAVTALGLAIYLGIAVPNVPVVPTAVAAVVLATLIGILNIRVNAIVTGLFLATELASLLAMTALGAAHPHRGLVQILLHPTYLAQSGHLAATPLSVIALATASAIYAYNGFGSAVSFGEEIHDAPKRIASVVLWALFVAVAAEIVPILAMVSGAPDLVNLLRAPTAAIAFIALGGSWFLKAVSLGIAVAIINAIIATTLVNARQLYATGRDGVWPASWNRALTRTHRRFHSPWVATLATGVLSASMCLVNLTSLVILTATGIVGTYALVCVSALVGRANGATAHGHYRMPLFPFAPILALVALAGVIWGSWLDAAQSRISLFENAAIMLAFAAYYLVVLKPRKGWVLRGPDGDLSLNPLA